MKITEPKTPYVRYNPETDEVEGMSGKLFQKSQVMVYRLNLSRNTSLYLGWPFSLALKHFKF